MTEFPRVEAVVVGVIATTLLLSGPLGGVALLETPPEGVGEGTASVTVVEPTTDEVEVTEGRFGAAPYYLRLPDLLVDLSNVDGRFRLVYEVELDDFADRREETLVTEGGRHRVDLADLALPERPTNETSAGRVVVRLQNFQPPDREVLNRSITVRVQP